MNHNQMNSSAKLKLSNKLIIKSQIKEDIKCQTIKNTK